MTKKQVTEIAIVMDRSGSMRQLADDVIGGFNSLINNQKNGNDQALVTLALFDHEYTLMYSGVPIEDVKALDHSTYIPRGMTAIYDAVGRTIQEVKGRVAKDANEDIERKVIFVIMTDGEENSSKEMTGKDLSEMIKEAKDQKWELLFIGADENSIKSETRAMGMGGLANSTYSMASRSTGRKFAPSSGITGQSTYASGGSYQGSMSISSEDVVQAFTAMNTAVSNYRSSGDVGDWTNADTVSNVSNSQDK